MDLAHMHIEASLTLIFAVLKFPNQIDLLAICKPSSQYKFDAITGSLNILKIFTVLSYFFNHEKSALKNG